MRLIHKCNLLILLATSAPGLLSLASAAPILRLSTATIPATVPEIDVMPNVSTTFSQVTFYNAGDGTLSPTFTPSASWMQATAGTPAACGAIAPSLMCTPINITVNATGLTIGSYSEFLTVTDPNAVDSPQTVSLIIKVIGVSPSVTLYAAPNGGQASATFQTQSPVNAQPSTASGGNWLAVSLNGAASYVTYFPYQIEVTTQPGQAVGDYTGAVAISGSNFAADNQNVSVLLHVTSSPIIAPSPTQLPLTVGQGLMVTQDISLANAGEGSLLVSGATVSYSSGSGWLTATVASGGGNVTVTADATSLAPGVYQGAIAISSNAANPASVPVTLLVTAQSGPLIAFNGVVNIGSNTPALAPGDIASVYGTSLTGSSTPVLATATPLPTSLGNVQVLVNGTPTGLYYVSDGQINFQVPYELDTGTAPVIQVKNGASGSNLISATAAPRQPEILQFYAAGSPPIIVDYTTGTIPTTLVTGSSIPSGPAHAGDTLVLYAVGLGATSPSIADLVAAPASPLAALANSIVSVSIGGIFDNIVQSTPAFVGLAPGFASLYQINFVLPANSPIGDNINIAISTNDGPKLVISNNVSIAIH